MKWRIPFDSGSLWTREQPILGLESNKTFGRQICCLQWARVLDPRMRDVPCLERPADCGCAVPHLVVLFDGIFVMWIYLRRAAHMYEDGFGAPAAPNVQRRE